MSGSSFLPSLAHVTSSIHARFSTSGTIGPLRALAQSGNAETVAQARAKICALVAEYYEDNTIRQDFLMTRARKP